MGYGRFVGRVGALAIALGVGMAAPGLATADTNADSSADAGTTPAAEKSAEKPTHDTATGAPSTSTSAGGTAASTGTPKTGDETDTGAAPDDAGHDIATDTDAAGRDGNAPGKHDRPEPRHSGSRDKQTSADRPSSKSADRTAGADAQTDRDTPSPKTLTAVEPKDTAPQRVTSSLQTATLTVSAATTGIAAKPDTPAASVDVPAPVTTPMQVTALLGALGVLPFSPQAPVGGSPVMALMWGAFRRTESQAETTTTPQSEVTTTEVVNAQSQADAKSAPVMMAMAAPLAASPSGPTAAFHVTDNWGQGFVANVDVTAGQSALNGWTVEFDSPAQITNIWNAEIASQNGTHYVVRNASWNATVGAGQTISFGFQATPGGASATATNFTVNGTPTGQPAPPSVSIADASVAEGNAGTRNMAFTVSLSKAATAPVTVGYSTSNGTATTGQDYTATSGTLTFAAGETTKTVNVAVAGDNTVEPNETLTVTLSNPNGATINDGSAIGTITNDDVAPTPPSVSIADATVTEGNSGSANLAFTVSLSKAATGPVTVGYTTSNGTATAGQDYTAASGTLTFAAGETTKTVNVAVTGDNSVEPNETLTVTLSSPNGATINDGSAIGTITNDDVTQAPSGPSATYTVTNSWADGFNANVTVNAGNSALKGWTVEFDSPAQITNIWNGAIASHTGTHYVVKNADYNGQVAAGQSTSFGFQASGTSTQVTNLKVNGVPVGQPTTPSISIADASVAEGNSGTKNMTFNVSLSQASTTPVTVGYTTSNGTATAGQDYTATSGTLTFAAGETTKTINVAVTGDNTAEPNETLTVTLSNPNGATINDGSAIGTITNDDAAPTPGLSISDASALEGDPGAGGIAPGFLHTSGNQIVDSTGKPVQISGVNWFGAQSSNGVPDGLWTRNYKDMIDQMSVEGFNTIRIPYASAMLHTNAAPSGIDYNKNPDLQGLSRIQVLDKIIDYAGQKGMRVILDHHRSTEGGGTSENGLWYDSQYTEDAWVSDWAALATRYKNNPTVIGFDLHNEPYNGTWGGGGATDWARAAERAGNAALAVNPNLLMFVEGVGTYKGDSYWWGGQLQGVKDRPVVFNVPNQLVYSPHDYPNSVYAQPWFQGDNFGAALPAKFRSEWGYIYEQNIAPIYLGEFGTRLQDPKDAVWLEAITSYLSGDLDNNGTIDIPAGTEDMSWTFWSWNPNSSDTGGILADDWRTINENKMVYLKPIEFQSGTGGTSLATFVVTLAQPSTSPVTVQYATSNGTATTGSDFIGASGSITFAPGETSKTITVVVLGDNATEGNETFTVLLSNPVGATIVDGTGAGTITDDEAAA